MDEKDKIIQQLKTDLGNIQNGYSALKFNFKEEQNINANLSKQVQQLKLENVRITQENIFLKERQNKLETELGLCLEKQSNLKPIPINKKWSELKTDRAKLKRKRNYKEILDESMRYVTECKRAKVTLTLGEHDVNLNWSEKEMTDHRKRLGLSTGNDTTNESSDENSEESTETLNFTNEQPNQIFNSDFTYTSRHKRKIITVLDHHRVSHRTYHAMRRAGKGELPPISQIKKEKAKMSKEIPFDTDEMVSLHIVLLTQP